MHGGAEIGVLWLAANGVFHVTITTTLHTPCHPRAVTVLASRPAVSRLMLTGGREASCKLEGCCDHWRCLILTATAERQVKKKREHQLYRIVSYRIVLCHLPHLLLHHSHHTPPRARALPHGYLSTKRPFPVSHGCPASRRRLVLSNDDKSEGAVVG